MADGPTIHRDALPPSVAPRPGEISTSAAFLDLDRPLPDLTEDLIARVERDYFAQLLARHRGNVARCAEHSGLSRRSVTQKLQKYSLDRNEFKLGRAESA
jgi:DNA-binding NtrC family response regulator